MRDRLHLNTSLRMAGSCKGPGVYRYNSTTVKRPLPSANRLLLYSHSPTEKRCRRPRSAQRSPQASVPLALVSGVTKDGTSTVQRVSHSCFLRLRRTRLCLPALRRAPKPSHRTSSSKMDQTSSPARLQSNLPTPRERSIDLVAPQPPPSAWSWSNFYS